MTVHGARGRPAAGAAAEAPPPPAAYPVDVAGVRDPRLSRWLWLVKWLLALPHLVVLVLLWAAPM